MEKKEFDFENLFSSNQTLFAIIVVISLLCYYLKKNVSIYLKRRDKLKSLAENYERRRKYREDLSYHYYWQLDSGEHEAARRTSIEILELDDELSELYEEYSQMKTKGVVDAKYI